VVFPCAGDGGPDTKRAEVDALNRKIHHNSSRMKVLSSERKELGGQTEALASLKVKRTNLEAVRLDLISRKLFSLVFCGV
jgi:hypothetical protein